MLFDLRTPEGSLKVPVIARETTRKWLIDVFTLATRRHRLFLNYALALPFQDPSCREEASACLTAINEAGWFNEKSFLDIGS